MRAVRVARHPAAYTDACASRGYRESLKTRPNDFATLNNLSRSLLRAAAPNDPSINDTIGWILVEQGNTKQGLEYLQRAVASSPRQSSIALDLAKAQIKDRRKDEARTTLQTLVKNAPDSPEGKESGSLIATINAAGR